MTKRLLSRWALFFCLSVLAGCAGTQNNKNLLDSEKNTNHKFSKDEKTNLRKIHTVYSSWHGVPYKYGGTSRRGLDCSSFVQKVYKNAFNINLPRTTKQQVKLGRWIPEETAKVGDLVFFKTGRNTRHVGVYIGNGKFVDSASSKGVTESSLDSYFWRSHFWQFRRVAPI